MPNATSATEAICTCDPQHLEIGATDPWCEVHAQTS